MEKTRQKLEESRYFLTQMKSVYPDPKTFVFNLSAFTSAARSVLWIMRSEYGGSPGWEEWFRSKTPGPEEKSFIASMAKIRNRNLKGAPITLRSKIEVAVPMEHMTDELERFLKQHIGRPLLLKLSDTRELEAVPSVTNEQRWGFRGKVERVFLAIDEFPDEDILEIAQKYFDVLESLVEECENKFLVEATGR